MAAFGIPGALTDAGDAPLGGALAPARDAQPWPLARRAWNAVWLLVVSLIFMQVDQGVIGFLACRAYTSKLVQHARGERRTNHVPGIMFLRHFSEPFCTMS